MTCSLFVYFSSELNMAIFTLANQFYSYLGNDYFLSFDLYYLFWCVWIKMRRRIFDKQTTRKWSWQILFRLRSLHRCCFRLTVSLKQASALFSRLTCVCLSSWLLLQIKFFSEYKWISIKSIPEYKK